MNESSLKRDLCDQLRSDLPGCVIFKHADRAAGVPDLSVTWQEKTFWLEIKFANPKLSTRELQHRRMLQLERHGNALYVVYRRHKENFWTTVLLPSSLPGEVFVPDRDTWVRKGLDHSLVSSALQESFSRTEDRDIGAR